MMHKSWEKAVVWYMLGSCTVIIQLWEHCHSEFLIGKMLSSSKMINEKMLIALNPETKYKSVFLVFNDH